MSRAEINNRSPTTILLVGRDFGRQEARVGRPFVGQAGELLNTALTEAGLSRDSVNVTNVVNRRPPNNDFQRHSNTDIEQGFSELRSLIEDLSPNLVVTLGNEASWATAQDWPGSSIRSAKKIRDRRGYVFKRFDGGKMIATIHPASILRSWVPWRSLIVEDLKKAKEESRSPEFKSPDREIKVVS